MISERVNTFSESACEALNGNRSTTQNFATFRPAMIVVICYSRQMNLVINGILEQSGR
jgi:hypothetical protein